MNLLFVTKKNYTDKNQSHVGNDGDEATPSVW